MSRKSKREIQRQVVKLEGRDDGEDGGIVVLITLDGSDRDWPDGVGMDDVRATDKTDDGAEWEHICAPVQYPDEYRDQGFACLTADEIAHIFDDMDEETRERELELRRERGDPIPPILEEDSA